MDSLPHKPEGLQIAEEPGLLRFAWKWRHRDITLPSGLVFWLLAGSAPAALIALLCSGVPVDSRPLGYAMTAALSGVWGLLTYVGLGQFLNRTTLELRREGLLVRSGPIPGVLRGTIERRFELTAPSQEMLESPFQAGMHENVEYASQRLRRFFRL